MTVFTSYLVSIVMIIAGTTDVECTSDFADHPVVGAWMLNYAPENSRDSLVMATFSLDGGFIEVNSCREGTWTPSGERTADLVVVDQRGGDILAFHARIEVDDDGQSLTATYIAEISSSSNDAGGYERTMAEGTVKGTRINLTEPSTSAIDPEVACT